MKNREITKPFFSPAQKKNDPTSAQKFRFYPNDKTPIVEDRHTIRPDARQIQQY